MTNFLQLAPVHKLFIKVVLCVTLSVCLTDMKLGSFYCFNWSLIESFSKIKLCFCVCVVILFIGVKLNRQLRQIYIMEHDWFLWKELVHLQSLSFICHVKKACLWATNTVIMLNCCKKRLNLNSECRRSFYYYYYY